MKKLILLLLAAVAIAGCVDQTAYEPLTELHLTGGGTEVYTFANDIRKTLKEVDVNDPEGIMAIGNSYDKYAIVYNGTDLQDVSYFKIVAINFAKIPIYYAYLGRVAVFDYYYFSENSWHNATGGEIESLPDFEDMPAIWMIGPGTGATDTSLNLVNNTIYLSGTSYRNLTMAGDRLSLLFFNIDEIGDIEGA
jgi:hypothetical protein